MKLVRSYLPASQGVPGRHPRAGRKDRSQLESGARTILAVVLVLSLAVFGLFVFLVIFDIRNLITNLTHKMLAVSQGDLKVPDFETIPQNDIGTLYECFNEMIGILKKLAFFIESAATATGHISASAHELDIAAEQSIGGAQQIASSLEELTAGTQEIAVNLNVSNKEMSIINEANAAMHRGVEEVEQGVESIRFPKASKAWLSPWKGWPPSQMSRPRTSKVLREFPRSNPPAPNRSFPMFNP